MTLEALMRDVAAAVAQVEAELPTMTWESARHGAMAHYTGRGPVWTIQLVSLDDGRQRMATASAGSTVIRLSEKFAEEIERVAKEGT